MDILDVVRQGSSASMELEQTNPLRAAAESLVSIMLRYDGFGVVGASPHAERVIGAAMMLDSNVHASGDGPTVIFDVSIASGTLIARVARRLRNFGNTQPLIGVALHSLVGHKNEWKSSELDYILVVDQKGASTMIAERSQGSEHGIMLVC